MSKAIIFDANGTPRYDPSFGDQLKPQVEAAGGKVCIVATAPESLDVVADAKTGWRKMTAVEVAAKAESAQLAVKAASDKDAAACVSAFSGLFAAAGLKAPTQDDVMAVVAAIRRGVVG